MSHRHEQIRQRFVDAIREHLADEPGASSEVAAMRDAGTALVESHAHLAAVVHGPPPVLQVRSDTLCVPVVGELDTARSAAIVDAVVGLTLACDIRDVIIDLSCAQPTRDTAPQLARVFAALAWLGVRGALSGIDSEIAGILASHPDELVGVRCFADLASALAALRSR